MLIRRDSRTVNQLVEYLDQPVGVLTELLPGLRLDRIGAHGKRQSERRNEEQPEQRGFHDRFIDRFRRPVERAGFRGPGGVGRSEQLELAGLRCRLGAWRRRPWL